MATNYIADGDTLDYTAAATHSSGDLIAVGELGALVLNDMVSGDVKPVRVAGVVEATKDTGAGTGWAQGGKVYLTSAGLLTGVLTANTLIGRGYEIAADGDVKGRVMLNVGIV